MMRNMLTGFVYRLQQFMIGRYGYDAFSKFLIFASLGFCVLSTVTGVYAFYLTAVALLIYSYFRVFSKNIYSRRRELSAYIKVKGKVAKRFNLQRKMFAERKMYKYIKCPKCKAVWRYPKGLGKIEISCKKCKHKMIKRT